jgi:hypothetical protein
VPLAAAITYILQTELQQVRNSQPQLLQSPEAKQHMAQVAAADEALQRRKTAVGQLAYVLDIAQDLDAAEASFAATTTSNAGNGDVFSSSSSSSSVGGSGLEQGGGRLGAAAAAAAAAPADLPSPEDLAALLGIE